MESQNEYTKYSKPKSVVGQLKNEIRVGALLSQTFSMGTDRKSNAKEVVVVYDPKNRQKSGKG